MIMTNACVQLLASETDKVVSPGGVVRLEQGQEKVLEVREVRFRTGSTLSPVCLVFGDSY